MRTVCKTLYQYEELPTEGAKSNARAWYRQRDTFDPDFTLRDAEAIGAALGFRDMKIHWSGFSCQGDGASFNGSYQYVAGWRKAVAAYCPLESKIIAIGKALQDVQRKRLYGLRAKFVNRGPYSHDGGMESETFDRDGREVYGDDARAIREAAREFARWIYEQLESEYWSTQEDEAVEESIIANQYEFHEDGSAAGDRATGMPFDY